MKPEAREISDAIQGLNTANDNYRASGSRRDAKKLERAFVMFALLIQKVYDDSDERE